MVPSAPADARKQLRHLLAQSSLIAAAVRKLEKAVTVFDAFPQLTLPICGDKWIAVGESAVAFDPLAGDGVSNALRGVILAVAALNGPADGLPIAATQDHYRRRLSDVFSSHIRSCIEHYQGAFPSAEWSREIETMRAHRTIPAGGGDYAFGLDGFRLVPLSGA
jgi:flavin-dependent dehydrogenase